MRKGFCQCGCNGRTRIAKWNSRAYGWKAGKPKRFILGHNAHGRIVTLAMREKIAKAQRGVSRVSGPDHVQWKGYKMMANGYRAKWLSKHVYQLEHRWVVEQRIGRILSPDEVVHHVNGNRLDNRPKNLVVMTRGDHT